MKAKTMRNFRIISILLILMLVLAACGGDDGDDGEANGGEEAASESGGQAELTIENLDEQLVLDNTGTFAEDQSFENFVVNYPSNWYGNQDGFDITISNSQEVEANHGAILAGTQDIPEGVILIQAQSQAVLQFSGLPVEDETNAEDLLAAFMMNFGQTGEPVPYEEIDLPAYRYVSVDGVEQFFPAGTVLVTVEYADGMALYQVVFDGSIQEFEPLAREIISNATIEN